jgi:hypothetical protein
MTSDILDYSRASPDGRLRKEEVSLAAASGGLHAVRGPKKLLLNGVEYAETLRLTWP